MRKYTLVACLTLSLTFVNFKISAAALNTLYTDNATFTIDKAMVSGASDLTNFVYLISLDANTEMETGGSGKIQSNGYDIVFAATTTSDETTAYKHVLESYDGATGKLVIWLQLTLSASVDTEFVMFYGRSGIAVNPSNASLWSDASFIGVWQLSETPGTGTIIDATGNSANGSSVGNVAIDGTSIVGQGYSFDGTGDYITIPRNAIIEPIGSFTISCWFKTAGVQKDYAKMFAKGQAAAPYSSYTLEMRPNSGSTNHDEEVGFQTARTNPNFELTDSNGNGKIDITTGKWNFFAGVISDAGSPNITQSFYLNGTLISSSTTYSAQAVNFYGGTYDLTIGGLYDGGIQNEFQGTIDELRIASVARNVDYLKTQVLNTACNANFVTITGNITGLSCTDATLPVTFVDFNAKKNNRDVVLNWNTASEQNNDYFTVERSFDGKNYEALAKIDGAGNSNEFLKYNFTDKYVNSNLIYYRIKQTDFDGTSDYSKIQKVLGQKFDKTIMSVYPNPNQGDLLTVSLSNFSGKQVNVNMTSISGQMIYSKIVSLDSNNMNHQIDTREIKPGQYIMTVTSQGQRFVERVIVNR